MKKLAFTTAIALALGTAAYAAGPGNSHGPGGGPGGGASVGGGANVSGSASMHAGPGNAGPSNFSRGPSNFSGNGMSGLHNQAPMTNTYKNNGGNYGQFKEGNNHNNGANFEGNHHRMYNYEGKNFEGKNFEGKNFEDHEGRGEHHEGRFDRDIGHHGVVSGNFFEHGRHFRFRRFFHGEWVFLNAWDDCTAYAWIHVAPGTWAWAPVDICVG